MYYAYVSESSLGLDEKFAESGNVESVIYKFQDRENYSTMMRASTVVNDVKIFINNYGIGVGDGNQGYWYKDNVPEWCLSSVEVQDIISSHTIPNGGGAFFPSFFSAFGMLGAIALIMFLRKYRKAYKIFQINGNRRVLFIYQIAIVIFLFSGWYTMGIKKSETLIFILTLPCISSFYQVNTYNKRNN